MRQVVQRVDAQVVADLVDRARTFLAYDRVVAYYEKLFTAERVLVLPLEILGCSPTDFAARILAFAGAEAKDDFSVNSERYKVGYSALEVSLCRPLNPFINRDSLNDYSSLYSPRMNQITKFLLPRIVRGLPASTRRRSSEKLDAEIAAWTSGRYIASNARCSKTFGKPLPRSVI